MDVAPALEWLRQTALAVEIRDSLFLFPLIESAHVVGLTLVFGTIAIVDLRLLGLASTHRPFHRVSADVFKWTWTAFLLTVITGALMFITNANVYFHNGYFRAKMALLLLAGINVAAFELTAARTVRQWDAEPAAPPLGRAVATVSLIVWLAVIVTGRMIGFTTTRAQTPEPSAPVDVNFDDLFGQPGDGGSAPAPPQPARE